MIDRLSAALNFDREALGLRNQRQQVLANNIANADTPNYKARDFDFSRALAQATARTAAQSSIALATTSSRHLSAKSGITSGADLLYRMPDQPSLDGNTVSMDQERTRFTDNAVRYQAALTLLNSRIRGLKSAMQPE
ncbi:flagellar basal body rod protein FlgB [Microbulbifer harenosus]|uniref:Flagellar basal body rod protein FlgB n=1 Tax=Microbulbifer harenosus TaxID=2576840 RepID=A0ABY2URY6_9GAMM|nr:flagellar basal body rod protein FlgB [Microbulbifer harenosus]TLM79959.1 flagellar basal body rod protein FlgB [Microbulbifer harenosus]